MSLLENPLYIISYRISILIHNILNIIGLATKSLQTSDRIWYLTADVS